MSKAGGTQNLPADVLQFIDQLDRHCLAPVGSLVTKSVYRDLQLAIYCEAIGMLEDYQQAILVANIEGFRDTHGQHSNHGLKNSSQV